MNTHLPPRWHLPLFLLILLPASSLAQSGSLDANFGLDGIVITSLDTFADKAHSLAIQPDGKIILGGSTQSSFTALAFALLRYHPDGSPDSSFGTNGVVISPIETRSEGHALAIQPDGKIILAGHSRWYLNMARYHPDGSLDSTFGTGGVVITDIEGYYNDRGTSIALQPDGKVLLGGYSQHFSNDMSYFLLARYQSDGSPDSSFGTGGHLIGRVGEARGMALQPDGKIILGGSSELDFALERYHSDGTVDTDFGQNGSVKVSTGGTDNGYVVHLLDDGKILLAGENHTGFLQSDFALLRFLDDGSLDQTFGNNGVTTTAFGATSKAHTMQVQSEGAILLAGEARDENGLSQIAMTRFLANGSLDLSFGNAGKVLTPVGNDYSSGQSLGFTDDGDIVVAGFVNTEARLDIALVKYVGNGNVSIPEFSGRQFKMRLYPHPLHEAATLEFDKPVRDATLRLYTYAGQLLREVRHISGQAVQVHRGNLPAGMYVMELREAGGIIGWEKLVVGE